MSGLNTSSISTRAKLMAATAAACVSAGLAGSAHAAPYASNVVVTGTTVNFILNENADTLTYSINGGAPVALTPTKGAQTFSLGAPTDTFSISTAKVDPAGYNVLTGATVGNVPLGLSQPTAGATVQQISDDGNLLNRFNSPRGVSVSNNPNASNFGTTYVSNSAAGATGGRTLIGEGMYAVRADQSDAFGYGDTAQQNALFSAVASANTPYRTTVGPSGEVYTTGFGDGVSGVWRMPADLSTITQLLNGTTGPSALPAGQNHGSMTGVFVSGSSTGGDLTVWGLDEDLSTFEATGAGANNDTNALWRWDIANHDYNGGPYTAMPTRISGALIGENFSIINDVDRGADGKFYLSQNRAQPANSTGIFVVDASGTTLFNSRTASQALLGNPTATDIFSNVFAIAVSPDQKWLAAMLNISDVALIPLIDGIPDIANRVILNTAPDTASGRDIAFDAAGNIHYVSSGQGLYRVLSPGGTSYSTTAWNGASYSFASSNGKLYWDINGTTAGGGGATPTGNWNGSTTNFNTDSAGGAGLLASTATFGDAVIFTAGTDGAGSFTVNVSGTQSAGSVVVARGNVTLAGGSIISGVYDVAAGATATVTSSVVGDVNTTSVTKKGAGTLTLTANNTYLGGTTVQAGTLEVNRMHDANPVTISGGTLRVVESAPGIGTGTPSGNNASVSRPLSLSVAAGATLDLTNNDLILDYTDALDNPAVAIEALIKLGYNNGDWFGTGITSSIAQQDPAYALAVADNALLTTPFASFDGQTVDDTTLLVKFTWVDDLDLDGLVTANDAIQFGNNYSPGDPATHMTGDMDYDGVFTANDAIIFGNNYDTSLPSLPEPGSLSVLALLGIGLRRRTRHRM